MPTLPLPGVDLHYETTGSGPLLLCITGAQGNGSAWEPLAKELSSKYTVVSYDRRGFSASTITGPQDYSDRLATDADDAAALIVHLSQDAPATVIGNSSGAIVALNLLLKHPDSSELCRRLRQHSADKLSSKFTMCTGSRARSLRWRLSLAGLRLAMKGS
jgi:pimeloyl-ACP methyl ester carboxylesterase